MKDRVSDLVIADTILPEQFMDTMRRSEAVQPEKALLIALLEDAIHNYRKYSTARDRAGKEHFHEAEHWIMHSRDHWIFSFENVCDLLGLDPEYLRRGLSEVASKKCKARKVAQAFASRSQPCVMKILKHPLGGRIILNGARGRARFNQPERTEDLCLY